MNKKRLHLIVELLIIALSWVSILLDFSIIPILIIFLGLVSIVLLVEDKETVEPKKIEEEKEKVEEETKIEEPVPETSDKVLDFPPDFDESKFVKNIFLLYRNIQNDFMNFEYETLMDRLGIEMYEQFSKQMKHLEDTGRQSVHKNMEFQKAQVMSYTQGKDCDKAVVNLSLLEDKYMKKMEEPFRLTSARVRYESCYALTVLKHHRKKVFRKCAYCGEKLQGNPTVCPHCNKMLLESSEHWILKDLKLVCSHSYQEIKKEKD